MNGRLFLALLMALSLAHAAEARTASLNLCADQLALAWLPAEELSGVSFNAADASLSLMADRTKGQRLLRGTLEELVALRPQKVLLGEGQNPQLRRWLEEQKIPLVTLGMADSLPAVQSEMRLFAARLGVPDRAEEAIAAQEKALGDARFVKPHLRVAVYYLRGFSDGSGTLLDEVIQRLGGINLAAEAGGRGMQRLSLEELVAGRPDLILLPRYGYGEEAGGDLARHPALAASGAKLVFLPGAYFACPHLAVEPLVRALGEAAMDSGQAQGYKHSHE